MTHLNTSCMMVNLTISCWTARRKDQAATTAATDAMSASRGSGRFTKRLVPDGALKTVTAAESKLRSIHKKYTLPWLDGGMRVLSSKAYFKYVGEMQVATAAFLAAVDTFVKMYPTYKQGAQKWLGHMYDERAFPSEHAIRSKFGARVQFMAFPKADDFRVEGIAEGHLSAIRDNIRQVESEVKRAARAEVKNRVVKVVGRVVERLRGYTVGSREGAFRDSLVENVRDLADVLDAINVDVDADVKGVQKVLVSLAGVDPDDLRRDEALRRSVSDEADAILKRMEVFA